MSPQPSEESKKARILIIDDTYENRLLLGSQLRIEGYEIIEAESGPEGIEIAHTQDPDIILLDIMMPMMDGFEVCKILREDPKSRHIPIIMVTARNDVDARIEGKRVGADEFLSRPHVREELIVRVRTLIEVKQARARLEEERNRLQLLYNISRAVNNNLNLNQMMSDIITETQKAVEAQKGNIMLLDETGDVTHKFLIRAGSPLEISDSVTKAVMSRGLGHWLLHNRETEIINDIRQDDRWITLPDHEEETGSAIGVALFGPNGPVGIIILNHPQVGYFTNEHRALLEAIGGTLSTAISNAYLFNNISEERSKLGAILAQTSDAIITTDEDWCISIINDTARRVFHLDDSHILQAVQDVPQLAQLVDIFAKGKTSAFTKEISVNASQTFFATVSPIRGVGYTAVMQDITELKKAEELKLQQIELEKKIVKDTFTRYMGPSLVDHVLSHEPGLLARRERRHAVVMFADIRESTRFTRLVDAEQVIASYNKFFTRMTEVVYQYEGTIFELTGDELLVAFNAPFDHEDAPVRALQTAVAMQIAFNALRKELFAELGAGFGMGIGIEQGDVIVGNVGAETRMTFRMVGVAINIAHRLVDIAADGEVVVSESIYKDVAKTAPDLLKEIKIEAMAPVHLKGKDEPETLYRGAITVNNKH